MPLPTEAEIRAFAVEIGAVNEDGSYSVSRNRLAAGAQKLQQEHTPSGEPTTPTVDELSRFHREVMRDPEISHLAADLTVAVAQALVRRQGLRLQEGTRNHE